MRKRITLTIVCMRFFYQVMLLAWAAVLYITFLKLFNFSAPAAFAFGFILIALNILVTLMWFVAMRGFAEWKIKLLWVLGLYFGTGHFLVLASGLYWLLFLWNRLVGYILPMELIGRSLMLLAVVVSGLGVRHSYQVKAVKYKIKIKKLPTKWHNRKIVMLADSHLGNIRGDRFMQKVVDLVNKQQPDLVLFPGDYFDGTPADLVELAQPMSRIESKFGVFFCDGNHEEFHHKVPFVNALEKANVKVLNNDFVELEGLQIVGVDYLSTRGARKLRKVLGKIHFDPQKPTILMKHVPSGFRAAKEAGVDLMLCGHTHLGQVFPFNLLVKIIFRGYDYGLKLYKNMQVITTSGVGTWGPPQRVGTNAEIVVITLE